MSSRAPNQTPALPPNQTPAVPPHQIRAVPPHRTPAVPPHQRRPDPGAREPLWRDLVGDVLRRERLDQERTLKDVAEAARISMPYLSEIERGRKEASSEVLAAAAHAVGLDLGSLLSRVHSEFSRRTAAVRRAPGSHNTLCLAA
ncbi:helix-turn-helix domain-containing protein [Streptomyces sp. NPDC001068]|uniref:helix-turn-helix domain-containing protein n=1 Tax=Streptomyces sp. NPDC001068 TaxID=3364544 RepID=UPI003677B63D